MALKYISGSTEEALFIRSAGAGSSAVVYTVPDGARLEGLIYPVNAGAVSININGSDVTLNNSNQACSVALPSGTVLRNVSTAYWVFSGKLVWA